MRMHVRGMASAVTARGWLEDVPGLIHEGAGHFVETVGSHIEADDNDGKSDLSRGRERPAGIGPDVGTRGVIGE